MTYPWNGHRKGKNKVDPKLCTFFLIYFNFTYYLGGSPFRLVKDPLTGYYLIHKWRPQQFICLLLNGLSLFRLIASIRSSIPEDSNSILYRNPTTYFNMVRQLTSLVYKMVTLKRFWLDSGKYQRILNVIVEEGANLPDAMITTKITNPCFSFIAFGSSVLYVAACLIGGSMYFTPVGAWTPTWLLRRLVAQARFVICFGEPLKPDEAPELDQITLWDGMLGLILLLSDYERLLIGQFVDQCLFASALTLWAATSSLSKFLQKSGDLDLHDAPGDSDNESGKNLNQNCGFRIRKLEKAQSLAGKKWTILFRMFQSIQKLSHAVNNALGSQVIWYVAEASIYYSTKLNAAFLNMDSYRRMLVLAYYVQNYAILYTSAEICQKMRSIKLWLIHKDNMKNVPPDEATLVLHEVIIAKDIGVKGSSIFTLTYPFIASFIGLVLTFFVICCQERG